MTNVVQSSIRDEVRGRFLSYAAYIIGDRSLPDIRDGLKPVHRRILYSMEELGLMPNRSYKKCARTVGDVLGKYHPHGDTSVYDAMVGMTQEWKMRYPLVDMHGNVGSIDGDPAAAMRYTEGRLDRHGSYMLRGIDDIVVDFKPNFDDSLTEPSVLPTFFPNLLGNGTTGIAAGMSTSIPPHHAGSLYAALQYAIDDAKEGRESDIEELIKIVQAPDFPTGGIITNLEEVQKGYRTGKGRVTIRSKYEIEEGKKDTSIVITEIPFQVNKAKLVEKIDTLRREKYKDDIKEVRDETARDGIRIVIDLKKGANPDFVVKNLMKHTELQSSFSMNMIALRAGRPIQFTLKDAIDDFLGHIADIITRRTERDLDKAMKRLHLVEGFIMIVDIIDDVIQTIKNAKTDAEVISDLMSQHQLSEAQSKAIAEMRLRRLSKESVTKFIEEKDLLEADINHFNAILEDSGVLLDQMSLELNEASENFKDERRTEISIEKSNIDDRDLIKEENLIVTISQKAIIKSVPADAYEAKGRGTKGVKSSMKEDDAIAHMFSVNSRDDLLFFTNTGRCHLLEVYKLPVMNKGQNGKYVSNYLSFDEGEYIVSVLPKEYGNNDMDIFMVTRFGIIKRLALSNLSTRFKQTRVISFKDNDELVAVQLMHQQDVILLTAKGQGLRFNPYADGKGVRPMGRSATGVKGIKLKEGDYVISMSVVEEGKDLLLVTDKGFGKRLAFDSIPAKGRAGQGVIVISLNDRVGTMSCAVNVSDEDDIMIATVSGILSRIHADTIRPMGRAAAGVKVINLNEDDEVISISSQDREEEEEESESGE